MIIKSLNIPEYQYPTRRGELCSKVVRRGGIGGYPEYMKNCRKTARYSVNGEFFCHQHAGEKCLEHLLKTQGDKEK